MLQLLEAGKPLPPDPGQIGRPKESAQSFLRRMDALQARYDAQFLKRKDWQVYLSSTPCIMLTLRLLAKSLSCHACMHMRNYSGMLLAKWIEGDEIGVRFLSLDRMKDALQGIIHPSIQSFITHFALCRPGALQQRLRIVRSTAFPCYWHSLKRPPESLWDLPAGLLT